MMNAILVGPGRAGLSLALAMEAGGHRFAAVVARDPAAAAAAATRLGSIPVDLGAELPAADVVLLAVRDGAIAEVAECIAPFVTKVSAAVHLSGLTGLEDLAPLAEAGLAVGSFHPLQTLPNPDLGVARLAGAWVAVDASSDGLRSVLRGLAESIGAVPFDVSPEARAAYHAAAAAAANFPLAALAMAQDLFEAAGVPFEAAEPLVQAVVENVFAIGPRPALTGPVARGDADTVRHQLAAVRRYAPEWEGAFRSFVGVLAEMTGQEMDLS